MTTNLSDYFSDDRKFVELSEIDKATFIQKLTSILEKREVELDKNFSDYCHSGYICYCPSCDKCRLTDRCACMCGSCYTCGYRWVCNADITFASPVTINSKQLTVVCPHENTQFVGYASLIGYYHCNDCGENIDPVEYAKLKGYFNVALVDYYIENIDKLNNFWKNMFALEYLEAMKRHKETTVSPET